MLEGIDNMLSLEIDGAGLSISLRFYLCGRLWYVDSDSFVKHFFVLPFSLSKYKKRRRERAE